MNYEKYAYYLHFYKSLTPKKSPAKERIAGD